MSFAGAGVGALCVFGYATQAASLSLGTAAGTSAFICSLQAVVVALIVGRQSGYVEDRTWVAVALSVPFAIAFTIAIARSVFTTSITSRSVRRRRRRGLPGRHVRWSDEASSLLSQPSCEAGVPFQLRHLRST